LSVNCHISKIMALSFSGKTPTEISKEYYEFAENN
jgi:hypothetical protein